MSAKRAPREKARVRYDLERLRHDTDHLAYEARSARQRYTGANVDLIAHWAGLEQQMRNDVAVYDALLTFLEDI